MESGDEGMEGESRVASNEIFTFPGTKGATGGHLTFLSFHFSSLSSVCLCVCVYACVAARPC